MTVILNFSLPCSQFALENTVLHMQEQAAAGLGEASVLRQLADASHASVRVPCGLGLA